MSWTGVVGQWRQLRTHVKEEWGRFAQATLADEEEKREMLVCTLQKLYGYDRERAKRELETLARLNIH